jgi:hypothetical protein
LHGRFDAYFGDHAAPDWTVHVFAAAAFTGRLRASAEGRLRWFDEEQLPYNQVWPSDRCWLPDLLAGRIGGFEAALWFDQRAESLLRIR